MLSAAALLVGIVLSGSLLQACRVKTASDSGMPIPNLASGDKAIKAPASADIPPAAPRAPAVKEKEPLAAGSGPGAAGGRDAAGGAEKPRVHGPGPPGELLPWPGRIGGWPTSRRACERLAGFIRGGRRGACRVNAVGGRRRPGKGTGRATVTGARGGSLRDEGPIRISVTTEERFVGAPQLLDCTRPDGVIAAAVRNAQEAWAKYLGRSVEETVEIANGVTMTFVLVPPGKFRMGSPQGETDRVKDETLHTVILTEPFDLGKYEVTQAQYAALVTRATTEKLKGKDRDPSHFKGVDLPVD